MSNKNESEMDAECPVNEEIPIVNDEDSDESTAQEIETEETEALSSQLLRLQADFDNFRKRMQKERADWFARANEDMVEELLPVLDHFEMGLNTAKEQETPPAVYEGFKLVYDQLVAVMKKFNVMAVDVENGMFDPHRHEAVTYMPSADVPAEHVVAQVRKGYMLGDKLIRPAQVVISSGTAEESE